ncbi:MAG: hypothetical protein JKY48_08650 [Flavobacteriales bacterium]|nr:hypothetical protein [Flavobacteriales bacterium]
MKKKTRIIVLITIGVLVSLFFYGKHNFENDKQTLLVLKSKAGNGEIKYSLDEMEEINSFSNPLINFAYQKWKKKIYARFITDEEIIKNTSDNKIINDISAIYREYWRAELLKENPDNRTDSLLYKNISKYILSNQLTKITKDSLERTIKNDSELKRIIEEEGFKSRFLYRNGFQDLVIWNKESSKNFKIILPKDTINTSVIFIENYNLNGYDYYASFGSAQAGGWAVKESATLYCNKGVYNLASEEFEISYLKHESLHFTDLNKYPNLSSTDLEYRAKIVELMYCTEKTITKRIAHFLNVADSTNRNHSHPYANYILMKNLSKLLFNSEYESDYNKWKQLPVEKINSTATTLYNMSENTLRKDRNLSEII